GDARRSRTGIRRPIGPRGAPLPRTRAACLRLVVRALGREPRLRHLVRALCTLHPRLRRPPHRPGGGLAAPGAERGRRLGGELPLLRGRELRRGRGQHRLADRLGGDVAAAHGPRGGPWPEPEYTGTGFPGDFYLNYGMYRHLFPTMALGMAGGLEQLSAAGGN